MTKHTYDQEQTLVLEILKLALCTMLSIPTKDENYLNTILMNLKQESMKVREVISHVGPIHIVILLSYF